MIILLIALIFAIIGTPIIIFRKQNELFGYLMIFIAATLILLVMVVTPVFVAVEGSKTYMENKKYDLILMVDGVNTEEELYNLNKQIDDFNTDLKYFKSIAEDYLWIGLFIRNDKYDDIDYIPMYYSLDEIPQD